jgi:hypothetical protein
MVLVGKSKRIFPSTTGRKNLYPEAVLQLGVSVKKDYDHAGGTARSYNAEVPAASCALVRALTLALRRHMS